MLAPLTLRSWLATPLRLHRAFLCLHAQLAPRHVVALLLVLLAAGCVAALTQARVFFGTAAAMVMAARLAPFSAAPAQARTVQVGVF